MENLPCVAGLIHGSICINVDWSPHEASPPASTLPSLPFGAYPKILRLNSLELFLQLTPLSRAFGRDIMYIDAADSATI